MSRTHLVQDNGQRLVRLFLCLSRMINQLSWWNHRCLMAVITNDRDGKHSKIGKTGSAMKQHETQPSSGTVKIHVVALYCCYTALYPCCCDHTLLLSLPHLKFRSGTMLWSLCSDLIFLKIFGAFRLKILISTKLYILSATPFNLVTMW